MRGSRDKIPWIPNANLIDPVPWSETTLKPITHTWVGTNKSDDLNSNCRSRKVLRDSQALRAVHVPADAKDVCLEHASS